MKSTKKLKKDLSRLASYLKKETVRLEKLASDGLDADGSSLANEIWGRLQARHRAAQADLDAIRAAEADAKAMKKQAGKAPAAPKAAKKSKEQKAKTPKADKVVREKPKKSKDTARKAAE